MSGNADLLANISAVVFGLTLAFFSQWAYSSQEPYKPKHLFFLSPLFFGMFFLGACFLVASFPNDIANAPMIAWSFLLVGVLLLLVSYVASIWLEWERRHRE